MPLELAQFGSDLVAGAVAGVVSGLVTGTVLLAHEKRWDQRKEDRTRLIELQQTVSDTEEAIDQAYGNARVKKILAQRAGNPMSEVEYANARRDASVMVSSKLKDLDNTLRRLSAFLSVQHSGLAKYLSARLRALDEEFSLWTNDSYPEEVRIALNDLAKAIRENREEILKEARLLDWTARRKIRVNGREIRVTEIQKIVLKHILSGDGTCYITSVDLPPTFKPTEILRPGELSQFWDSTNETVAARYVEAVRSLHKEGYLDRKQKDRESYRLSKKGWDVALAIEKYDA